MGRLLRGLTGAEGTARRWMGRRWQHGTAILDPLEAKVLLSAVIATDRQDYPFGSTAYITGSGFAANEVVQLQVLHAPGTGGSNDHPQNVPWDVAADAAGNVSATWQVTEPDAVGATFDVLASGLTGGETAETEFTDGIGGPTSLGSGGNQNNETSVNSSNLKFAVAVGKTMFVTVAMDANSGTVSVTDTSGNTYTPDADVTNGSGTSGVRTLIFSAPVTTALTTSSHVTITFETTTVSKAFSVFDASGLMTALPEDQSSTNIGSGTSPNSGSTAATTQAAELLIGAIGSETGSNGINAWGASFSSVGSSAGSGGGSSGITVQTGSRTVSATGSYSASASVLTSANWAAAIVTYKAQLPTPAFSNLTASGGISYGTPNVELSGTLAAGAAPAPDGETVTVTIDGIAQNATISGGDGGFSISYPTAGLMASGTPYTIRYSYAGDGTFLPASDNSTTLTVNQATPEILWSNPADIVYGTVLDVNQLNASTMVPGEMHYTPDVGTVLNAGAGQTLSVDFTPDDQIDYTDATADVTIDVAAANTALSVDDGAAGFGQQAALTALVTNTQTAAVVNEGTVTFSVMLGDTVIGTVDSDTVSGGVASAAFSLAGVSPGNYTVMATYNPAAGNANFNAGSTATAAALTVSPAATAFSNLSGSQAVVTGTPSVELSGTLAAGSLPAPDGETVAVMIDGIEQDTVTAGGDGAFAMTFDLTGIPASVTPYRISYQYAGDGNFAPASDSSTTLTVVDPMPVVDSVAITPANPGTDDALTAVVAAHDDNGNAPTLAYQWFVNGEAIDGATGAALDLSGIGNGDKGDAMTVQVTPNDGEMSGTAVTSAAVIIGDTAPVIDVVTVTPADPLTDDVLTANLTSHDADGDVLTYAYQWFKNDVAIDGATTGTLDLSAVGDGEKGDAITVQVTPNDGEVDGDTVNSSVVIIHDTAPTIDSVTISPATPLTNDVLTASVTSHDVDDDTVTYTYQWFVNGEALDGATDATLDLSAGGNKHDLIAVQVTPNDGEADGDAILSAAVTVGDTAPSVDAVTITPVEPLTNDILVTNVTSHDADGDAVTYTFQWLKNGNPIDGATAATLDLSTVGNGNDGDFIAVQVTPDDGEIDGTAVTSAAVAIGNTAPVVNTVSITPATPLTDDILTANVTAHDVDGDDLTYAYQWFKNNVAIDGATDVMLDLSGIGKGDKGDAITVQVTPNDGAMDGEAVTSAAVVINDTAPIIDSVTISPATPLMNDLLTANVSSHDADGDDVTYVYQWFLNGEAIDGATAGTLDLSTTGNGDKGDAITVQVMPDDGEMDGDAVTSAVVTVSDTAPVVDAVTITPANPLTDDILTANVSGHDADGDAVTYSYQWFKNQNPIDGATGATLDLSAVGDGDKGDAITVQVTPNDGETSGDSLTSAAVIVSDTAPAVDAVTITPANPLTNDVLTASVTSHDADGDAVSVRYQWFKNDVAIDGATGATLDLTVVGNGDKGDAVTVRVTPNDGEVDGQVVTSAAVIVVDTAPVIDAVTITPANPLTNDVLTANVTSHDADGDAVSFSYQWYLNGGAINEATSGTLDLSSIGAMPADELLVTVAPSDGTLTGLPVSADATVQPAPLVLSGLFDQSGVEGSAMDVALGSVSNPGWAANDYSGTIDWGDGTTSSFDQSAAGSLGTLSKTYADDGNYTVSVTVSDAHGATAGGAFTAQVADTAPTLSLSGDSVARKGVPYTLTLTSSDPGDDTVSSWNVNWGDGSIQQVVAASARTFDAATGHWETSTEITHTFTASAADNSISATATDEDGTYDAGSDVAVAVESATVVARRLFYGNSRFSPNGNDGAIAIDKSPLMPGETATFANYSSYVKGINGIIVDLAGSFGTLTAGDFVVRLGNDNNPAGWAAGPAPAVTVRPGAGVNGSARIELTWADGAMADEWVQITVLANNDSGLNADDVFYFGNAVGDTGNSATDATVSPADEDGVRRNATDLVNPAPVISAYDFNRDGKINAIDQIIARNDVTTTETALQLITPGGFSLAPAPGSTAPSDGVPGVAINSGNGGGDTADTGSGSITGNAQSRMLILPSVTQNLVTATTRASVRGKHHKQANLAPALITQNRIAPVKRRAAGNLLLGFENLWNRMFYKR